jgi:hypothetical protein
MSGLSNNVSDARNVAVWVIFMAALLIFLCLLHAAQGSARRRTLGEAVRSRLRDVESQRAEPVSAFDAVCHASQTVEPRIVLGGDEQHTGNKELWTTLVVIGLIGLFIWRMQTLGG